MSWLRANAARWGLNRLLNREPQRERQLLGTEPEPDAAHGPELGKPFEDGANGAGDGLFGMPGVRTAPCGATGATVVCSRARIRVTLRRCRAMPSGSFHAVSSQPTTLLVMVPRPAGATGVARVDRNDDADCGPVVLGQTP